MGNPFKPDPKGRTRLMGWSTGVSGPEGVARINLLSGIADVNYELYKTAVVRGSASIDDGLGGVWEYRSGSSDTPDGYTVISAVGGNWHKVV